MPLKPPFQRATTLKQLVANAGDRSPLEGDSWQLWVDADAARGEALAELMAIFFEDNIGSHQSVLFAGHQGSGKTTELHRLSMMLESEFLVIPVPVSRFLDLNNLKYVDLLILLYEQIFLKVTQPDPEFGPLVPLSSDLLTQTHAFLDEVIRTSETSRSTSTELEVGAKGAITHIFGTLRSRFKYSTEEKFLIRARLEPQISSLLTHCNALIANIETTLSTDGYKRRRLLLVVEELDKLGPHEAREIFYDNAHLLAQLRVDVIYTIPNALLFGPQAHLLSRAFTETFILPTIKPIDKEGSPYVPGIDSLREILERRFDPSLFETGVLDELIRKSGGLIRDMLSVIQWAGLQARVQRASAISLSHIRFGLTKLRQEYERMIAASEPEGITTEDYRRRLRDIHSGRNLIPDNDKVLLNLLLTSLVIEYNNGERRLSVHPLIAEHLEALDGH